MTDIKIIGLSAGISLQDRPGVTLGDFCDSSIAFLQKLQPLHPLLRDGLYFVGRSRKSSAEVRVDMANAEDWIIRNSWSSDTPKNWYTKLNDKLRPTRQSTCKIGFRTTVSNLSPKKVDQIRIGMSCSGVSIKFPASGYPEFSDFEFLKELLRLMVEHWEPESGSVGNQALHEVTVVSRSRDPLVFGVGWLNYIDDPRAATDLPTGIDAEPFGPGGIFFALQEEPPIDEVRLQSAIPKALAVRDALFPGLWLVQGKEHRTISAPSG